MRSPGTWLGLLLLALVASAGPGCVAKRVPLREPAAKTPRAPYDFSKEGKTPAPRAVEPAPASASLDSGSTLEAPQRTDLRSSAVVVQDLARAPENPPAAPPPSSAPQPPAGRNGYRVQVFASPDRAGAEKVLHEIESRLGERAYIEYAAPYYKVRVGNCPSSDACHDLEAKLRQAGYGSIWTVPSTIEP